MPTEFSVIHHVQFSETDMAGIAHFSNYFRWMEEVEHAFFRSMGMSVSMQHDGMHIGWPRVSAACDYTGPVKFEDDVELKLRVVKVGEKSFSYEVIFSVAGKQVALGRTTSVCCTIDSGGMRSISIPPTLREKLTA